MRTQVDTTQRQNKNKQSTTKSDKDPMQSRHNPKKKQKQTINKYQIKTLCKVDTTQRKNKSKLSTKIR
jgi:hypothetical protein